MEFEEGFLQRDKILRARDVVVAHTLRADVLKTLARALKARPESPGVSPPGLEKSPVPPVAPLPVLFVATPLLSDWALLPRGSALKTPVLLDPDVIDM